MAVKILDSLIDKNDTFEIVRDKLAEILKVESVNQVAKATTALKPNPNEWALRVFTEAARPFDQFLGENPSQIPLVNVWYDTSSFPGDSGDSIERQLSESIFNIDCYAYAPASDNPAGGHNPGDKAAALILHRTIRFVRNILMANINTYLQLRGIVWGRWPQSINAFNPDFEDFKVQNAIAGRFALRAKFNEFSPQQTPEILELVSIDIKRKSDGEIILETDYDQT